jgi:hypothetical protein
MAVFDILMIDDERGNFEMLRNSFAKREVVLTYAVTLEEGMEKLRANDRIMAIILDGKGFIKRKTEVQTPKESFVHQAISEIEKWEREKDKLYPKCILTAWGDELKNAFDGRPYKIFDKKDLANNESVKKEMFDFLITQVKDTEPYRVRHLYKNEFNWMDERYFSVSPDAKLFQILLSLERKNSQEHNLNLCRQLFEVVVSEINAKDKSVVPDDLIKSTRGPNLTNILLYWKGKEIRFDRNVVYPKNHESRIPEHICVFAQFLKDSTNLGSHDYRHGLNNYTYTAVVNALLVVLEWYVSLCNRKKN